MDTSADDEAFSKQSAGFIKWLTQNGTTISLKIELTDLRSRSSGRGVVAKEDISEEEELFRIPKSSILTTSTSNIPEEIRDSIEDPWLALILAMVYEYQLQAESSWRPYFDVLPSHFDTLMYWSEEELQFLHGSAVLDKIGKQSADRAFTEQILPIIQQHEATFHASALSDSAILALCHRMGSTIMAYAFDLATPSSSASQNEEDGWEEDSEDEETQPKGMVPLADMLNADATRNNARLFYEADAVAMKALRPIAAGEEVFNDYGPLPRADLLRRYGYVTDNYTPYDVVEISLTLVKDVAKREIQGISHEDIETRLQYLGDQDVLDDGYDISHSNDEDGPFPDELKILLNALVIPTSDFDRLRSKDRLPKPTLSLEGLHLLRSVLAERETMYAQDANSVESGATESTSTMNGIVMNGSRTPSRATMAAQVVAGEKAVITAALATVSDLVASEKKRKVDESDGGTSQPNQPSSKKTKGSMRY